MSSSRTIIIVDDDASMGLAIERLLTAAGWKARIFLSAEALLESGAADSASGFIFDIQLPGLSGFALHETLQKAGIRVPVAFITAHDRPSAQTQAERAGAMGYFLKPFNGRSLLEVLDHHCPAA